MSQADAKQTLERLARDRILVLDGAMGTMVQRHGPDEAAFRGERFRHHRQDLRGNNDILVLTQPALIRGIHAEYLAAGADILETSTFSATRIAQADYGLESVVADLNYEAARLARSAADEWSNRTPDRPRLVAGAIGPTNKTLSLSPRVEDPGYRAVSFDEVVDAYVEQVRALIDGGVDILLPETIIDTLNAKASLLAIRRVLDERGLDLPVMVSVTMTDQSGRTLSGQTVAAFWASIAHSRPFSVGMNCALGARQMRPHLAELARVAATRISAYPNAGLPNAFGGF
ncbi:MAG: homocysteine S-methyltransferase family protein, partial [Deltaproteobacteria bacterium]|nr:homocysteine S-methyltransferase family protein [Deltaproteobacteria bacterium]